MLFAIRGLRFRNVHRGIHLSLSGARGDIHLVGSSVCRPHMRLFQFMCSCYTWPGQPKVLSRIL